MTIEKCKDFIKDGYGTWDDTSKPTTFANMYDFIKNQNNVVMNLASGLWQPSTDYSVGAVVHSPSLPAGCKATCTTAGTSGTTEPKWTAYGTTVTDGTVKWKIETDVQGTMDGEWKKADETLQANIASTYLPAVVGAVVAFAGSTTPQGWLLCDGSAVSRTDYAALYAVIGTTYGAGNGSTTFNLPNLVNRMAVGSGSSYAIAATGGEASHKLTINELPPQSPYGIQSVYQDGGLKTAAAANSGPYAGRIVVCGGEGGKGIVSYGGNQPHNNMPPYLALRYIIKY